MNDKPIGPIKSKNLPSLPNDWADKKIPTLQNVRCELKSDLTDTTIGVINNISKSDITSTVNGNTGCIGDYDIGIVDLVSTPLVVIAVIVLFSLPVFFYIFSGGETKNNTSNKPLCDKELVSTDSPNIGSPVLGESVDVNGLTTYSSDGVLNSYIFIIFFDFFSIIFFATLTYLLMLYIIR